MKLRYALLAEGVNLDQETLSVWASSILDDMVVNLPPGSQLPEAPVLPFPCTFLTVWSGEGEIESSFDFWIEAPEGSGPKQTIVLPLGGNERFLHRIRLQGLKLQGNGEYRFMVSFPHADTPVVATAWVLRLQVVP